jgi:CheY-like chemotaxis protein
MHKMGLIYIIDDDDIFVFVVRKLLLKSNHFDEVINIGNGLEAIDLLIYEYETNKKLPEIIFLDLNMPVLDGWQFLDQVEKLPFKELLRIYIISSSIDVKEIEKAKTYSTVKSFVSKPITVEWLNGVK